MNDWNGVRRKIGRYEVIDEIGSGGFSNVYHAHDTVLDREVAVKVMRPFLMSEPEFVIRFQREAKTAANLDHPNIVPIYDHGEEEGQLYIVMKLIPGGTLAGPLAEGPLPWERVVAITREIAAALDYAHQHGLVHRDVKPENILLDDRGTAQVSDFGVVKALEKSTTTLSMSGGILGSPAYIAPEIWSGQSPAPAADIYALSCMIFEMVTGRKLYAAPTPPAAMALHFRPRQYPESWPEGTPSGLADVLDHGLAQNPERRFATASELAEAIASLDEDRLAAPYEALLATIESQNWPEAVELAESISARDEDYRDVRQLLAQATHARAEAERKVWVNKWRDQASEASQAGEWQMAITAARQWLRLSPDDPQAQELISQAQEALEKVEEQAAAEEPAEEAAPDPLAQAYEALQQADRQENWDEAQALAEKIIAQNPGYRGVEDYLNRARAGQEASARAARIDRLRLEAQKAVSAADWQRARQAAEAWLELAPDDAAARRIIRQAEEAQTEPAAPAETASAEEKNAGEPVQASVEPDKQSAESRPLSASEYFSSYRLRLRSGEPSLLPAIILFSLALLFALARFGLNFDEIIASTAAISMIGFGAFFVLILGEIDLSATAVATMTGFVLAGLTDGGLPGIIAILIGLALAVSVGLLQGWVISKTSLPSYVVTLAGLIFLFGVTAYFFAGNDFMPVHSDAVYYITQGPGLPLVLGWLSALVVTAAYGYLRLTGRRMSAPRADDGAPRGIKIVQVVLLGLGLSLFVLITSYNGRGMPLITPILLLLLFVFAYVAYSTRFGASVYAVGQDKEAAARAGIDVKRTQMLVFALSGLMAGVGGVVLTSKFGGATIAWSTDMVLLLMVIGAPVIGGTSVFGGRGRIDGVLIGGLLMATISYGAQMEFWLQPVLVGLIFVLALVIDTVFHRRRLRAGEE